MRYHSGSERVEIEHESLLSILDSITNTGNSQTPQGSYDECSACLVKSSDIETDTSAINTEDSSTNKKRQVKSVEDGKKTIGRDSEVVKNVDEHIDEYGIYHDDPVDSDKAGVFDTHEVDVKEISTLKEKSNIDETEPRVETQLQKQTRMSEVVDHVDVRIGVGCARDSDDFISTVIERNAQDDQGTQHDDELHHDDTEDYPEESCLETKHVDDDLISEENEAKLMTFNESIQVDDEIDEIDDGNGAFKSANEIDSLHEHSVNKNTEVNTAGMKDKDQDGESEHMDEISNEIQDEIDIKMTDDNCADTKGNEHGRGEVDFEGEDIEECDEEAGINAADKNTDDINNNYGSENTQVKIHDEDSRNTQDHRENLDNENITEEENDETHDEDFRNTQEDFHNDDNPDNENNDDNITDASHIVTRGDSTQDDFDHRDNPDNENSDDNITREENDENNDEDFRNTQEDFDNENNNENITEEENDETDDEDFRNAEDDFHYNDNSDNENNDENITKEKSDDNNDEYFRNTHEDFHHHNNPDNENNDENITEEENDEDTSNSQEDFDHRDHPDNENNGDNITDVSHFVTREGCNSDVATRNLERNEDRDSCKIS